MHSLLAAAGWAVRLATSTTSFASVLLPLLFTLSSMLIQCSRCRSHVGDVVFTSIDETHQAMLGGACSVDPVLHAHRALHSTKLFHRSYEKKKRGSTYLDSCVHRTGCRMGTIVTSISIGEAICPSTASSKETRRSNNYCIIERGKKGALYQHCQRQEIRFFVRPEPSVASFPRSPCPTRFSLVRQKEALIIV
jgi:hypothetical protein